MFVVLFSDSIKPFRRAENVQFWTFGFLVPFLACELCSVVFLSSMEDVLVNLSLR